MRNEHLRSAQRIKVVVLRVERAAKGPQVIVSRSHRSLLRRLFELEVPEIQSGTVEIKSIAREGGHRSKVAVHSRIPSIDPIGACVGPRGSRIQNIVNELGGERIDVIKYDANFANFVSNALSPAQVLEADADHDAKRVAVVVPDSMLSLAIGKDGQNARLAAKLTGWNIDIRSQSAATRIAAGEDVEAASSFAPAAPGEEPDIDVIPEVEEVALVEPTPMPAPTPMPQPTMTPAAASDEEDIPFSVAVAQMPVPDRDERESEDYGEEDDEEYEVPAAIVPDTKPTAIRFAEDVLGQQRETEEAAKKAAVAKRPPRRGRFQEEEEEEEFDYSGRIH